MAIPVNDELVDRAIRHAHYLERLKTHEATKIVKLFHEDVIPDLTKQIQRSLRREKLGFSIQATKRLQRLKRTTNGIIAGGMRNAYSTFQGDLKDLALTEANWQASVLRSAMPIDTSFSIPSLPMLHSAITSRPMEGKFIRDWFNELSKKTQVEVSRQINIGLVQGQSVPNIVRRLTGTARLGFRDGVVSSAERHVTTHVRTSINHISTHAREMTYGENVDVIKAVRIVATLDARTTDICMGEDGKVYPINEGWRPPGHHQCRTTTVPVTKSWKELGIKAKEISFSTRASMSGQVPSKITYSQWIKKQPVAIQNEALGVRRAILFRQGEITIDKFVDVSGHSLTLAELAKKEGLKIPQLKK